MVRRTEGLLSARCHDEEANFLALNLAHDIIQGNKTVEEAKQYYLETMKDFRKGKATPYMDGLLFEPHEDAADPGENLISTEEMKQIEEEYA